MQKVFVLSVKLIQGPIINIIIVNHHQLTSSTSKSTSTASFFLFRLALKILYLFLSIYFL